MLCYTPAKHEDEEIYYFKAILIIHNPQSIDIIIMIMHDNKRTRSCNTKPKLVYQKFCMAAGYGLALVPWWGTP